jgi:hypothetical protein
MLVPVSVDAGMNCEEPSSGKSPVSQDSETASSTSYGVVSVPSNVPPSRTLFIGSVAASVTHDDLYSLCQKLARVETVSYVGRIVFAAHRNFVGYTRLLFLDPQGPH